MDLKLFQKKKKRGKRKKREPFAAWFPRLSAVTFVFCLFAFLASDFPKLIQNSPFMFNFVFGIIILAIIILTWKKNKIAGASFITLGLIYGVATWDSLLAVSSISTSFWLVATGFLFIVSDRKIDSRASQAVAHDQKFTEKS